ncbi:hypothetical protein ANCCAN_11791 [Ancylostoma caninum]|uniref:Uncharacterized protein n=1 Tax=Ancylostoma caninum TaxID=29170 RepID=A0A368GGR9_ANCCA|nr:hypothetical protein ANCCAN_11791 [Ancylostoma caninum]
MGHSCIRDNLHWNSGSNSLLLWTSSSSTTRLFLT